MNNIDEDIEMAKEVARELRLYVDENKIRKGRAISTVLSELSNLKWKNEIYVKSIKSHKELIENKDKELETWKKIAEKLAEECTMFKRIQQIDFDNEYSNGLVYMTKEEVLYWARKEVENEQNNNT